MTEEPDFAQALKGGLASIAGQIIDSCTLAIPVPPEGKVINRENTNLIVTRGNGETVVILPDNQADCSEGWRFNDAGDVQLCAASCEEIRLDEKATVQLTFGCGIDQSVPMR